MKKSLYCEVPFKDGVAKIKHQIPVRSNNCVISTPCHPLCEDYLKAINNGRNVTTHQNPFIHNS